MLPGQAEHTGPWYWHTHSMWRQSSDLFGSYFVIRGNAAQNQVTLGKKKKKDAKKHRTIRIRIN